MQIAASELILNPDGSIYHLHLRPENIAQTIITVGDPDRVADVSKHFDRIEFKTKKREFVTHTGYIGDLRLSVISTGIGTDNIDIVLNELDALVNIDFETRTVKEKLTALNLIRIGTSGCLRPEIPVDSILVSAMSMGMDGLLSFYKRNLSPTEAAFQKEVEAFFTTEAIPFLVHPQVAAASDFWLNAFDNEGWYRGITITATGFYAPQSRILRAESAYPSFLDQFESFSFNELRFTNLEMETAGIYGMANLLGHQAISLNALLANRPNGTFSKDPKAIVNKLIVESLETLCALPKIP
jgi:uridine phosphorylase